MCVWMCVWEHTRRLQGIETIRDRMEIFLCPRGILPPPYTHSTNTHIYTHTAGTHQVFEERSELLGKDWELEESWTQIRIISVHTVFSKLLQSLSILLLVLYVGWKTQKHTHIHRSALMVEGLSLSDRYMSEINHVTLIMYGGLSAHNDQLSRLVSPSVTVQGRAAW